MVLPAVRMLMERIADPDRPTRCERFPSELVIRASTAHTTLPARLQDEPA